MSVCRVRSPTPAPLQSVEGNEEALRDRRGRSREPALDLSAPDYAALLEGAPRVQLLFISWRPVVANYGAVRSALKTQRPRAKGQSGPSVGDPLITPFPGGAPAESCEGSSAPAAARARPFPVQQRGGNRCRGVPAAPLSQGYLRRCSALLKRQCTLKTLTCSEGSFLGLFYFFASRGPAAPPALPSPAVTKSEWVLPWAQRQPAGPGGVTCRPCSAGLGAAPPAAAAAVSDTHGAQPARRAGSGPMSGGGGAAGPRLYGYGGALPPAALLRRDLAAPAAAVAAAGTSRVEGAAVGTVAAGAAPPPFSSALGCAAAQVPRLAFLLLLQPRRALRIVQREREGRFDAATPSLLFLFCFILFWIIISRTLPCIAPLRGLCRRQGQQCPPGKPEPCGCVSPGPEELTLGVDLLTRGGFRAPRNRPGWCLCGLQTAGSGERHPRGASCRACVPFPQRLYFSQHQLFHFTFFKCLFTRALDTVNVYGALDLNGSWQFERHLPRQPGDPQ